MKSEIFSLFPTPLYVGTLERPLTKEELDFVHRDNIYTLSGNRGGSNRFDLLQCSEMLDIKLFIQHHLDNFAKSVMCIENNIFPTLSWLNRNPTGKDHYRHYHVNSIISGVFYFTPNPAPIEFYVHKTVVYDPLKFKPKEFNTFNSNSSTVTLTQGTLLLFPSYIEHAVLSNLDMHDRISLSFNTWVHGQIGDLVSSDYLDLDNPELNYSDTSILDLSTGK
jgi:uncharacterized protein (TIGR02466 family)